MGEVTVGSVTVGSVGEGSSSLDEEEVIVGSGASVEVGSHAVTGLAVTQLQSAPTDLTTPRASPKPHAPTTQLSAVAWMAADESQRHL